MEKIVNMNITGYQSALKEISTKNGITREQAAERYPELAGLAYPKDFGANTPFGKRNADKIKQQRKEAEQS
jgi:hypothetical protein